MKLSGRCMFLIRDMEIARPKKPHRNAKNERNIKTKEPKTKT
jgi:hypothetical protein